MQRIQALYLYLKDAVEIAGHKTSQLFQSWLTGGPRRHNNFNNSFCFSMTYWDFRIWGVGQKCFQNIMLYKITTEWHSEVGEYLWYIIYYILYKYYKSDTLTWENICSTWLKEMISSYATWQTYVSGSCHLGDPGAGRKVNLLRPLMAING